VTAFILNAAGYSVGLYTSPHLYDYTERIRVFSGPAGFQESEDSFAGKITDDELAALVADARPGIEEVHAQQERFGRISFFEVYTALALYHFYRCGVDFAVLETGMGGRLDATNATSSLVCGITPISLEHTEVLGATVSEIAGEKAAIIKDRIQRVVVGEQVPEALAVIKNRCREIGAGALYIGADIRYEAPTLNGKQQKFDLTTTKDRYESLATSLLGPHQLANIAMAIGLAEALNDLGHAVPTQAIRQGISRARWPGRFEIVAGGPSIVLDGAHHPDSAQALAATAREIFPQQKIIVILGCSMDKDLDGIARHINPIADCVILTKADHPRSRDFSEAEAARLFPGKECRRTASVAEAIATALKQAAKDDVVLVTGSLFLVGEARKICIN
jgi:dihydrofolate synthase/folylpolyglutamate synthase